jgi:pre-mRNA-splicing factor RBM22/SLT11
MASIKRDDVKQKWEETEFPLVCETCLGDNPYVRMTKQEHAKKCKICETPFTVFAWQAGTKGRLKKVEICRSCAQAKNVCQVCIYDLQYGLPVKVRDKILRETGGSGSSAIAAVPQSMANRSWFMAQQERALAQGQDLVGAADAIAHAQLQGMANMEPRYERNLPKLCSFFARGECNRGADCPFRHEMPRDRNDPLSKQNTKDRFYGTNDPVAGKLFARMKRLEEEGKEEAKAQDGYDQARATVYLKLQGDGQFPTLSEGDVRDQFYSFGEIVSVRVIADKAQAFVEYTQPEAAELAIATMNRKMLQGHNMYVSWARAPKRGNAPERRGDTATDNSTAMRPAAPPGALFSKAKLPAGLVAVRPPPEVAAIAAARRNQAASAPSLSVVPRPGGGVIRGAGAAAAKRETGSTKPYYPSADPSRLGSRTSSST